MSEKLRINRYLAEAGLGSRRKCEELIGRGEVFVNGKRVEKLSLLIDPDRDSVTIAGRRADITEKKVVVVLNKPVGVLSAVTDSFKRKTVIDLARENGFSERLFPIGRLDYNTSGILLLTNDGNLSFRLTHPRFKVEKTYRVTVEGGVSDQTVSAIVSGVNEGDFVTQPCLVKIIEKRRGYTELEIRLKEGQKRQIRKVFALFGHKVVKLHRSALGDLEFEDLETGEMRILHPHEVRRLRELAGLQ